MPQVGENWFVETQGVRVVARSGADGYYLTLSDSEQQPAGIASHPYVVADLDQALSIARSLIETHLRFDRHVPIDWDALFALAWQRLPSRRG
jgi:hypothetical protein